MTGASPFLPRRQRGVALAVVVWFLAGMSLLVAGIVMSARTDTRLAQVHYARAQVTAAGDGAINLLLADLRDGVLQLEGGTLPQGRYQVGEEIVSVHAVPVNALVDASNASIGQLAAVARAGGLGGDVGEGLARAVVQYRDSPTRRVRIDSIEDLLGAGGVNRAALDALRDYITVTPLAPRSAGVSASGETARQTERGSESRADTVRLLQQWTPIARSKNPDLLARGRLSGPGGGTRYTSGGSYRIDALVQRDRDVWLRRRWSMPGAGPGGLPWRFQRTEPARMVPRS